MARKKSPKTASPSDTTQAFNEETHSVENVPSIESELPDQPEESAATETLAPLPNDEPIEAEAVVLQLAARPAICKPRHRAQQQAAPACCAPACCG